MLLAGKTAVLVGIGFDKNLRQPPDYKGDVTLGSDFFRYQCLATLKASRPAMKNWTVRQVWIYLEDRTVQATLNKDQL